MQQQFFILLDTFQEFLNEIATSLPKIIGAIIIFIIGWILAKVVKSLVIKILRFLKFTALSESSGIEKFLRDSNIKYSSTQLIGILFYWIIMLITIMASLNSVGLDSAKELFNEIILFIPNVIVSVVVLLVGLNVARFLSNSIASSLTQLQEDNIRLIKKLVYYSVVVFTISIVMSQLNIAKEIIINSFQLLFGAFCLAIAIAFGLGGKQFATDIINSLKNREKVNTKKPTSKKKSNKKK